jgi:hypothetical protein
MLVGVVSAFSPGHFADHMTGLGVWRRLGELSTDLYAFGIHREHKHSLSTTPWFLTQIRRKLYCNVYQYDKSYATLFDRPPRLPKLYADCKPPLDLTDEQVLADMPETLVEVHLGVTEAGWNVSQIYSSATWARLRFLLGGFREELLPHSLGASESETKLKETQLG